MSDPWTDRVMADWAEFNLYDAAMALRHTSNGAADPLSAADVATVRRVLADRIGPGWRPSLTPERARVDEAVRELVRAVLEETAEP